MDLEHLPIAPAAVGSIAELSNHSETRRKVAITAPAKRPTYPYVSRERHHNEGQGRRLTTAFEAVEAFPMLVATRNRVLQLFEEGEPATADLIRAVEGDIALTISV